MAKNFKGMGDVWNHTASGAIAAGDVVVMSAIVGVALAAIADGAVGAVAVEGLFAVTKKSGDTFAQGEAVYWDTTPGEATSTSSGNTLMGHAAEAAASGDATVTVLLNV
jgi:predicted RecA/RadA family phage recombinase